MFDVNYTGSGSNSGRGPSPSIWQNCPILEFIENPGKGVFFQDDFLNFSQHVSDQDTQQYSSYIDTGVTMKQLPVVNGVMEVAGNDADNDEGSITTGGNTGTLAMLADDGTAGELWFECRIKKASIADNACGYFVGLAEEGLAAADTLVDNTGAMADKDMVGFRVLQDNGEEVDFAWSKAGDGVATVEIANLATMAADTYIKLGFHYNPKAATTKRITIFVNGVEYTTYVTNTQMVAATFPAGEELALLLATKVGTAAESKFQMDWWRVAQRAIA